MDQAASDGDALRAALARIAELERTITALRVRLGEQDPAATVADEPAAARVLTVDAPVGADAPPVCHTSSTDAKLALFQDLFTGRTDVYATRWENTAAGSKGWSPAVKGGWYGRDEVAHVFLPLTSDVLARHLTAHDDPRQDVHVGLYPLIKDDRCRLLACDFDKTGWREDAAAYHAACAQAGIDAAVEVSRSGNGAHAWTFFREPVRASAARSLGVLLLHRAMLARASSRLDSFDRFFPAQDTLPIHGKGRHRFGNLIALPLHGPSRRAGTTVFCDPATWAPREDQFAFLSTRRRLSAAEVDDLIEQLGPLHIGPVRRSEGAPKVRRRDLAGSGAPEVVPATLASGLTISTAGVPAVLVAALKHAASLHNPEFYRRQTARLPTFGVPRFIGCYQQDETALRLPRGLADDAADLVAAAGGRLEVTCELAEPKRIKARFTGKLTAQQRDAVAAMTPHPTGVLVAPTGKGKTVMACALVARHKTPTAIVVNRAALLGQWLARLETFLDLAGHKAGVLGQGKDTRGRIVDVIMLQTLSHRDAPDNLLDGYGLVIVDECHALGAQAGQAAIDRAPVRRLLGLTATPFRSDGLDDIITMQAGPVRHTMTATAQLPQRLLVHPTAFTTQESARSGASIQAIYNELACDPDRTARVAHDIAQAAGRGRNILALSNRVEHLENLAAALARHGVKPMLLHGRVPRPVRDEVHARLAHESEQVVLLAIDKIAGEGLDVGRLDTLFLAAPIAFKGRVIQHAGRVMRLGAPGKTDIEIHDYADDEVPLLAVMRRKRARALAHLGFTPSAPPAPPAPPGQTLLTDLLPATPPAGPAASKRVSAAPVGGNGRVCRGCGDPLPVQTGRPGRPPVRCEPCRTGKRPPSSRPGTT